MSHDHKGKKRLFVLLFIVLLVALFFLWKALSQEEHTVGDQSIPVTHAQAIDSVEEQGKAEVNQAENNNAVVDSLIAPHQSEEPTKSLHRFNSHLGAEGGHDLVEFFDGLESGLEASPDDLMRAIDAAYFCTRASDKKLKHKYGNYKQDPNFIKLCGGFIDSDQAAYNALYMVQRELRADNISKYELHAIDQREGRNRGVEEALRVVQYSNNLGAIMGAMNYLVSQNIILLSLIDAQGAAQVNALQVEYNGYLYATCMRLGDCSKNSFYYHFYCAAKKKPKCPADALGLLDAMRQTMAPLDFNMAMKMAAFLNSPPPRELPFG